MSSKPKCLNPHCNELNHYGDKYDGYCLECRNAGAGELIDELAAVIAERDRLRAEVERLRSGIKSRIDWIGEYQVPETYPIVRLRKALEQLLEAP